MTAARQQKAFQRFSTEIGSGTYAIKAELSPHYKVLNFFNFLSQKCQILSRISKIVLLRGCPASPEKEDQRAAGSPAALTQPALCLRLAIDLKGRKLATRRNPR
jgi:hypothetical protein